MTHFRVARYTLEIFDDEGAALMDGSRARLFVEADNAGMTATDFRFYDSAPGASTAADGSSLAWMPMSALPAVMQVLRDFDPVTLNTGAMVPGESLSVRFSFGKG